MVAHNSKLCMTWMSLKFRRSIFELSPFISIPYITLTIEVQSGKRGWNQWVNIFLRVFSITPVRTCVLRTRCMPGGARCGFREQSDRRDKLRQELLSQLVRPSLRRPGYNEYEPERHATFWLLRWYQSGFERLPRCWWRFQRYRQVFEIWGQGS